jgi:tetratricopeptide (TPR) repeat protein
MPEFLVTGDSPQGRTETVRLEAPTADAAVKRLQQQGYREIVLHTDDVSARYTQQSAVEETISPEEFVRLRNLGPLGNLLFLLRKMYAQNRPGHVVAIAVIAARRYFGWEWGFLDYLAIAWLAFPLVFALGAHFYFNSPKLYEQLLDAIAWGRWEEALQRIPSVRGKLPDEEVAFQEAQALAGLGRFDEAMKVLKPYSDGEAMPAWLYWGRISDVYHIAGKDELIIPAHEKAAELAPDNPTVLLDLAMALVRYQRESERPRKLVQQARTHALSDVLAIFADMIEGMIEVEAGNPAQARDLLEKSLSALAPFQSASPLIGAGIDRIHAYLALAHAGLGDHRRAAEHYRRAKPRLKALKSTDLIDRCEAALHGTPAST